MVSARLAEAVLRDEGSVFAVSSYQPDYGVSLSLPAVPGRAVVARTAAVARHRLCAGVLEGVLSGAGPRFRGLGLELVRRTRCERAILIGRVFHIRR